MTPEPSGRRKIKASQHSGGTGASSFEPCTTARRLIAAGTNASSATDDAFAALPPGTVETLLEDPTGDLATILTYHVVPGAVLAADVVGLDSQEVTTVEGSSFTVNVGGDGSVTLTDAAGNEVAVVVTDIQTSNGVIHVIDSVVMPS